MELAPKSHGISPRSGAAHGTVVGNRSEVATEAVGAVITEVVSDVDEDVSAGAVEVVDVSNGGGEVRCMSSD